MRLVFDTNVLIDGFADNFNAQARLIDAVREGEHEAIVTDQTEREYKLILRRLINDERYRSRINDFLSMTTKVNASAPLDVVIDDKEDEKFLRAAIGGKADVVVTNDHHLLDLGEIGDIRIVKPTEAWAMVEDDSGGNSAWNDFIRGIGIGR